MIGDKMLRLAKAFTDYFNTRSFQVFNCQKIGLGRYISKKGNTLSCYYTIDGNRILLFPSDRLAEYPDKIYTLAGKMGVASMDSSNRAIHFADGCQLFFPNAKEFKQMLYIYEDLKGAQEE
jgi:hypothetical protein